ncbi:MAG: HIT family protein [Gammaproteobacteria bacterium]|nr:HIT family protein [Gammaproteobacteria bacterium]
MVYDNDNIFAKILRGEMPSTRVFEDADTLAIMDVMPQADGHTLILPKTPAADLFELPDRASTAVMRTTKIVAEAVSRAFNADGIRLMQLNGPAAGQTVFHFHMHIIPCHADRPLRRHVGEMADPATLEAHADLIRAALGAG